jgi:hypothetical protein
VKPFTAILFSVLLVWTQITSASVSISPVCTTPAAQHCNGGCDQMACCESKPLPNSRPAPVVPAQSNFQNQVPFPALTQFVWTLPKKSATGVPSASASSSLATVENPLYERNCALLL